jgi:predicted permease
MLALLVVAVLSIAAANIAILLLARGTARRRELDVRRALGATRARIVVQLLVESLLLSLAGGAVGLLLAVWLARVLASLVPFEFWVPLVPDAMVFGFAFGVSALVALLFGLLPALRAARPPAATARVGGRDGGLRDLLVVAQVAVSIVLVVAAGLFARSLRTAQAVDLGYETTGRVAVRVNFSMHGYSEEAARTATREIFDRLRSLSGAEAVSGVELLPFSGDWGNCFQVPGVELPEGQDEFCSGFNRVGAGYFELMGHPVLRGREFEAADETGSGHVVVVNHTAAMQIWGTDDVVGRTILLEDTPGSGNTVPWTVVGVVGDATYAELGGEPQPFVYADAMQYFLPYLDFLVKARPGAAGLVAAIHEQIHAVDPELALADTRSLDEIVAGQLAPYRSATTFVGIFGALAVALALVGLYAVLAYAVARRRREIGIRVALGATTVDITGRILGRGIALVLIGTAIGVAVAWAFAGLATAYLYGVEPHDPAAFLLAPAALLLAALLAGAPPALQAARLDPVDELRRE